MNKLFILTLTAVFSSFAAAATNNAPKPTAFEITFKAIDTNVDGFISLAEAENKKGLLHAFPDLDLNRDSNLTETEYEKFTTIIPQKKQNSQQL